MEWPDVRGMTIVVHSRPYEPNEVCYDEPHRCDREDCPGPRLVARLEAAEQMAEAIRARSPRMMVEALSAYESASEPVKERT